MHYIILGEDVKIFLRGNGGMEPSVGLEPTVRFLSTDYKSVAIATKRTRHWDNVHYVIHYGVWESVMFIM